MSIYIYIYIYIAEGTAMGLCALIDMYGLSCPAGCEILVPQSELKPTVPALQSRFLTTGQQGSPQKYIFLDAYAFRNGNHGLAVKNPSAMQETQETQVHSLGWEVPRRRKWPEKSHRERSLAATIQRVSKSQRQLSD